jgi:uncharacterized protein YlaI
MQVTCLFCRKSFDIDQSDHQYLRIKRNQTKQYICTICNKNIQQEAQSNVDYDPSLLDPKGYDKLK